MKERYKPMTDIQKSRVKILEGMHNYIIDLGDEEVYDWWLVGPVPDEPSDEDFETIATNDDLWLRTIKWFYLTVKDAIE